MTRSAPATPRIRFDGWGRCQLRSLLILGSILGFSDFGRAASPVLPHNEYAIKAAALYNIVPFVDWPETAFPSTKAPLIIGVLGQDPFGEIIDHLVENEIVRDRTIVLERYASADLIGNCQLLFIARSEQRNWSKIQQAIGQRPILTVSDAENFAARGGTVQFSIVRLKLRIIVNVKATRQAGLTVSSKLLRLAEVIGETDP